MAAKLEKPVQELCEEIREDGSDTRTEESLGHIEEEDITFFDVDLLVEHGIALDDIKQLKKSGINTVKGIQMCTRKKLSTLKGFSEEKVNKIKDACGKICPVSTAGCFLTGLEVCEQRKQLFTLTTGSKNIDKIIGGGVESMSITEVFGEARTGKTQLAHTLCVTAQLPTDTGYTGGKVMYIDTERTFRPDRIKPIADRFELDSNAVLDNILYARAYNSEHQYELLNSVSDKFHEEPGMFKLLIIDSIMALFRVDFTGSAEMTERQSKLGLMLSKLQKISEEYNVAVFLTNQITTDLQYSLINDLDIKPVGGNILAHSSTTRIALRKAKGNVRIARLFDSPKLEEQEVEFVIRNGGVSDPEKTE
ncbi:meiotic recombination protein DMC1/LIM15 homolog [Dendroctonus ponderosae]|uniref:RecA family profile 1 domain-containing protein n=1 Tax=Dendroctonus ponderosae TaxID=77166 RepID=A0AAR5Q5I5_DENPD|nr:meiotic recombination protein DMC1/LIM15 homolog [Dendroctonus ponderosae]XP_019768513.1 meiotic recombination protein DMC1/LIM15 homolog [Dendroctonus ponderosae]